jgi:hypothetical protein
LDGERALLYVEGFFLAAVNVRRIPGTRWNQHLRHEKGTAGFLAGSQKLNLVYGTTIGQTCSCGHNNWLIHEVLVLPL